jgi:glycosyltransferase involved in cell wall biosynthesis
VSARPDAGWPIRPLLLVDSLDVGGAERHVADLALALEHEGHKPEVACSVAGPLSARLDGAGVPVRPLVGRLVKRRASAAYAHRLRRLVRGGRFVLVHAHVYASTVAAAVATLGAGIPLVVTEHTEATWQGPGARLLNGWVCRRAGRVIAVSNAIRRRAIERDRVPPERVTVVPNAVAPAAAPDHSPPDLPDGLCGRPLVGVVARHQPEKGVQTFLKAAARVALRFPETRFPIIGDGPLRGELELLAERVGLSGRAFFLGFRSDASSIMRSLDVLVVPSRTEGSPLVTLEAMAAGVPVLASAVGGIPDQIRHESEGLLVPPGDPVALSDALLRLLEDPGFARALGEAGSLRAATEFGYATMLRRIEAVYRAALGRPPAHESEVPEEPEPLVAE